MNKVVNPAYLRFGFTLGFSLGSILLYQYAWQNGIMHAAYFHNFLIIISCVFFGLFTGACSTSMFYKLAPAYSPYSNLDALLIDWWHCTAAIALFWGMASFFHFIISFKPELYINNPSFPEIEITLLVSGIILLMGTCFSLVKLIEGALRNNFLMMMGPFIVGITIGGFQGYLLGNELIGIPVDMFLNSETVRIIIGAGLGFIISPIAYSLAIQTKIKDLRELA